MTGTNQEDEATGRNPGCGYDRNPFERLRLENEQLKEELIDLQRRHVELQREHIELLEEQNQKRTRHTMTDGERDRIVELARSGARPRDIADEVGRSANTVRTVIWVARQSGRLPPLVPGE